MNSRKHRDPDWNRCFAGDKSCMIVHDESRHERCGVPLVRVYVDPSTSVDEMVSRPGSDLSPSPWRALIPSRFRGTIDGDESVCVRKALFRDPERLEYVLQHRL